jgi:AcrR family transcriptional regulator
MVTRKEQKAATRSRILTAAATEFASHGFAGTSISSIAAALGQQKSAISYSQFRSKQEIATAIMAQQMELWRGLREEVDASVPPGLPRLLSLLLAAALDSRENPFSLATVRLLVESRRLGAPEVPDLVFRWYEFADAQMLEALRLGQLPAGTDVVAAGRLILSASFGLFEAENNGLRQVDTGAALQGLWRRLLVGFGADADEVLLRVRR